MTRYYRVIALPVPKGVKLISWKPKPPPVRLSDYETVTDVDKFVRSVLRQLDHCLKGETWLAGNWSLEVLLKRLAMCGCVVELQDPGKAQQ
jgi:hypothetical protein